ncbi:cell death abnormality protein 1-like [Malaya genurostris]|uniref:cell death abnormality protein 1-like n=1 Tax=Malaya genurostris TaxID=325434 RepID=UPI0026F3A7E3|nr:cell death abnormality protein 1-like [Malaya genurostris]
MFAKVILLVVALQACLVSSDTPGIRQTAAGIFQIAPMAAPFLTHKCENNNFGAGCTECQKGSLCLGSEQPVEVDCTLTSGTPYCNKDQCSAVPLEVCEANARVEKFICTAEGFFPDPKQCENYHYCEDANAASDIYNCPSGYVYNPVTGACKLKSSASDCVVIKCPSASGYGTYGTNRTLYAYCVYTRTPVVLSQTILFKCAPNTAFDGSACVYQCTKEGNFENSADMSTYYQCSISGEGWLSQLLNCPSGKKFDATKQICLVPN